MDLLEEIPNKPIKKQKPFSEEKFTSAILKCNNSSTPRLDKLSQKHLKIIIKDIVCLRHLINIADVCIELGHWPSHFKTLAFIIIPKPNKVLYNSSKAFRPIVLLNILSKLIEKVISNVMVLNPQCWIKEQLLY